MPVTVERFDLTEADEVIAILDLPLPSPPPPNGAEWIEACRHWVREP